MIGPYPWEISPLDRSRYLVGVDMLISRRNKFVFPERKFPPKANFPGKYGTRDHFPRREKDRNFSCDARTVIAQTRARCYVLFGKPLWPSFRLLSVSSLSISSSLPPFLFGKVNRQIIKGISLARRSRKACIIWAPFWRRLDVPTPRVVEAVSGDCSLRRFSPARTEYDFGNDYTADRLS